MHILIIEDDPSVASFASRGLKESGHTVDVASDGSQGLELACSGSFDVLVIDRMLPGTDGLAIIRSLRSAGSRVPILVLSAMAEVDQRVEGFNAGSDDYLTKPFAFSELLARIEALHRRNAQEAATSKLTLDDLVLDRLGREVTRSGENIALQPREFRLLEYLMLHAGQVVTRTMLLEKVWDYHFDPQTNVIDVHISRLRQKIDRPDSDESMIRTVRGAGYVISAGGPS
ncbi:MAG: response regulator transcription factor [Pseudomonadota bacterium]